MCGLGMGYSSIINSGPGDLTSQLAQAPSHHNCPRLGYEPVPRHTTSRIIIAVYQRHCSIGVAVGVGQCWILCTPSTTSSYQQQQLLPGTKNYCCKSDGVRNQESLMQWAVMCSSVIDAMDDGQSQLLCMPPTTFSEEQQQYRCCNELWPSANVSYIVVDLQSTTSLA